VNPLLGGSGTPQLQQVLLAACTVFKLVPSASTQAQRFTAKLLSSTSTCTACHADIALMQFFGALDSNNTMPDRSQLQPRTDDRNNRTCRTIGAFAVYMHDFGLNKFDSRFRDDQDCWNSTFSNNSAVPASCGGDVDRHYTWWCNKRPNNPCVFNCPNQVCSWLLQPFGQVGQHHHCAPGLLRCQLIAAAQVLPLRDGMLWLAGFSLIPVPVVGESTASRNVPVLP
jgi:hypothetical protein